MVDVVGEERPDRPVYMAGDPRTPFTPLPRGRSAGPEGEQRVYTPVCASVVFVDSRARAHTKDGDSERVKGEDLERNGR